MAFSLKGYIAFAKHLVPVLDQLPGVPVLLVKLRLLVFQHNLAVNDMLDDGVAVHLNFHCHPLVAVISF